MVSGSLTNKKGYFFEGFQAWQAEKKETCQMEGPEGPNTQA